MKGCDKLLDSQSNVEIVDARVWSCLQDRDNIQRQVRSGIGGTYPGEVEMSHSELRISLRSIRRNGHGEILVVWQVVRVRNGDLRRVRSIVKELPRDIDWRRADVVRVVGARQQADDDRNFLRPFHSGLNIAYYGINNQMRGLYFAVAYGL